MSSSAANLPRVPSAPPRLSVVIPLYNCVDLSRRCLETLLATLPAELTREIILVDDGSTDGTRDWLATLPPPCRVLLNERNLGFAATCNRGAAAASGEFIALLNDDLELLPGWLEPMLAGFDRVSRAGIIGNLQLQAATRELDHAGLIIGSDGKPAHVRVMPAESRARPGYVRMPAVTGACVLIPRSLFVELGSFDEDFRNGGEDVDFCFRALGAGWTTWTALKSTVLHHVSASPGRSLRNEENSYRLYCRWRPVIEREAWRTWCQEFLAAEHAGALPRHPRASWRARVFLRGWLPRPGRWAETSVHQNLLTEQVRWERLLSVDGKAVAT